MSSIVTEKRFAACSFHSGQITFCCKVPVNKIDRDYWMILVYACKDLCYLKLKIKLHSEKYFREVELSQVISLCSICENVGQFRRTLDKL